MHAASSRVLPITTSNVLLSRLTIRDECNATRRVKFCCRLSVKGTFYLSFKVYLADGQVRCPSQTVSRHIADNLTSNLTKHINACTGRFPTEGVQTMTSFTAGSTYRREAFNQKAVKWIVRRHLAFSTFDHPELHELFKMLYARVDIPTGMTIAQYTHQYYDLSKIKVKESLCVSFLFSSYYLNSARLLDSY